MPDWHHDRGCLWEIQQQGAAPQTCEVVIFGCFLLHTVYGVATGLNRSAAGVRRRRRPSEDYGNSVLGLRTLHYEVEKGLGGTPPPATINAIEDTRASEYPPKDSPGTDITYVNRGALGGVSHTSRDHSKHTSLVQSRGWQLRQCTLVS